MQRRLIITDVSGLSNVPIFKEQAVEDGADSLFRNIGILFK